MLALAGAGALWWWHTSRPDYLLAQARAALERGQTEAAERQALLFEASGDRDRGHLLRGCLLLQDKQYAKALERLNQIRDQGALRREAASLVGRCLLELGELYQAERAFVFLLQDDPDHLDAHRGLSAVYFDQGDFTRALRHCQEWARLRPAEGKPHRFMGFIYRHLEQHEPAVSCYRDALARELSQAVREEVRLELAHSLIKRGEFAAAQDVLAQSEPPRVGLAQKLTLLAECARGLARLPRARSLVEQALGMDPAYVPALRLAGMLFVEQGEFDKAVRPLEHAVQLDTHDLTSRSSLSQAYVGLGRAEHARRQQARIKETENLLAELNRLSERLMANPRDGPTHQRLAEVFDKLNRPADAARSRRNAQALHGGPMRKAQSADVVP